MEDFGGDGQKIVRSYRLPEKARQSPLYRQRARHARRRGGYKRLGGLKSAPVLFRALRRGRIYFASGARRRGRGFSLLYFGLAGRRNVKGGSLFARKTFRSLCRVDIEMSPTMGVLSATQVLRINPFAIQQGYDGGLFKTRSI